MKEEAKHKKAFMKRYKNYLVRIERMQEKLELLDQQLINLKSPVISDMPRGGVPQTKDDVLIKLDETDQRISRMEDHAESIRSEILIALDNLDDYRFAEVLEDYFLDELTFEEIAVKRSYSVRHVGYLYARGLDCINIDAV